MRILGLSAFYHDSAAALIEDGRIVAAAQEERFTRRKHDPSFPRNALACCLAEARIDLSGVDLVAFYDKPFLKFERLVETYLAFAPRGFRSFRRALPAWTGGKLFQKELIRRELQALAPDVDWRGRMLFAEHHQSHAASAFFPSPFEEAAILTMDGVGEWATTTAGFGRGNELELRKELRFPHSLGLLYSAFTYYLGFKVNSGEYKVMGLAPYGEPRYAGLILDHLIDLKPDGSFRLNQDYFDYCTGEVMTGARWNTLFGGEPRRPETPLTQRHKDLAASIQAVTEEVVLRLTRALANETGARNLCLAGGVALNCVANAKVLKDGRFDAIWIQPAAGDAGGALGAALAAWHGLAGGARDLETPGDRMQGALLGPSFTQSEVEARLAACGARFDVLSDGDLTDTVARDLARGETVGWMQGRMEFGPRALGARSILADPRRADMQDILNHQVKRRESFRPFAPAVLQEHARDWFALAPDSPYMLLTAEVAPDRRSCRTIPAVTHVDGSARVQTVTADANPRFHALLSAFHRVTGCPMLVNTSFNLRGEPIVCAPEDAFRCFMATGIDVMVAYNCYLRKSTQNPQLMADYGSALQPD